MTLPIDTCTFLWLAADDPKLSATARASCLSPDHEVCLSALSAWEFAIKHRLGRLPLPLPTRDYVVSRRKWLGLEALAFDELCAAHDTRLPPYHEDPFDRGLVCQAILNGMTIGTTDPAIQMYSAPTLW